jgi:acetolactate synthase-1/2/3 large subunit
MPASRLMTNSAATPVTLAAAMAATLKAAGVRHIFGVPGGGSSLDVIAAADRAGIEFVLCRGETAAALAASVAAELTGAPGVVLTAIGPGAASAVNGIAYAHLERAPLLLICDAREAGEILPPHQVFDLQAMFKPIVKAGARLAPHTGAAEFAELAALTRRAPEGPVLIELSAGAAAGSAGTPPTAAISAPADGPRKDAASAREMLAASRRPVLLAGLQAVRADLAGKLTRFAETLRCPAMTSYKAKGVIADGHPQMIGHLTGADGEAAALSRADLVIWAGLEPVELIPVPWRHSAPILALSDRSGLDYPASPVAELIGPLTDSLDAIATSAPPTDWQAEEIAEFKSDLASRLSLAGGDGHTAESVIRAVVAAADPKTRFTVDAGAHMLSVMAGIQAVEPLQVLKSTGLSTMGFALPAAIASSLAEPERRVIAFTGDGGLMMCLAELSTAARLGCRLTVVVINDAALSLIDVKQQRKQHRPIGISYPAVDFAAAARGQGCRAWKVESGDNLPPVVAEALEFAGTGLIDVMIDPSPYGGQLAALRG